MIHDPLCTKYISGDDLPCICDLLAEHATLIRDEIAARIEWAADDAYAEIKLTRYDGRGDDLIRADDIGRVSGMREAALIAKGDQ